MSGFEDVVEIVPMPPTTPVPGAQPWLLGIGNLRGNLFPVIDLKHFLEGERTVLHEGQRVLVVRQAGGDVALTIDELYGQRSFTEDQGVRAGRAGGRALRRISWSARSMATSMTGESLRCRCWRARRNSVRPRCKRPRSAEADHKGRWKRPGTAARNAATGIRRREAGFVRKGSGTTGSRIWRGTGSASPDRIETLLHFVQFPGV